MKPKLLVNYPHWYVLENVCRIENSCQCFSQYTSGVVKKMLLVAVQENRQIFLKQLFDYYNIPDELTLKEKISYYYLVGENNIE